MAEVTMVLPTSVSVPVTRTMLWLWLWLGDDGGLEGLGGEVGVVGGGGAYAG
jgi:hypothetical protein